MEPRFENYKGIHPGIVIARELQKRSIKQRPFALALGEHPQTFNAITKARRNLTTILALKIEQSLDLEEGTLSFLQVYYDIKLAKNELEAAKPNLAKLRRSLFWDTDFDSINWVSQYKPVIKRVFEKGSEDEQAELIRFYGKAKVDSVLNNLKTLPATIY